MGTDSSIVPSRLGDPHTAAGPGTRGGQPVTSGRAVGSSAVRGPLRLGARGSAIAVGVVILIWLYATDQIVPASSARQAELRIWLAARAAGLASLGLLGAQVVIGLVLSHPTNRTTWKLSKRIFPWHEHLWVFVIAFIAMHVVSLVIDPYAGVGLAGAFIPGLSGYRSAPVALGTLALYAFVITALTARWTKLLPPGAWLTVHRLAFLVFALSWLHGLVAGTDSAALEAVYVVLGLAVLAATGHRYWVVRADARQPRLSRGEVAVE